MVDIASGAAAEGLDNALATGAFNEVTVVVQSVSSLISQTQKENFTGKRLDDFARADKNLPFQLIPQQLLHPPGNKIGFMQCINKFAASRVYNCATNCLGTLIVGSTQHWQHNIPTRFIELFQQCYQSFQA